MVFKRRVSQSRGLKRAQERFKLSLNRADINHYDKRTAKVQKFHKPFQKILKKRNPVFTTPFLQPRFYNPVFTAPFLQHLNLGLLKFHDVAFAHL
jgi:hypothetical protein